MRMFCLDKNILILFQLKLYIFMLFISYKINENFPYINTFLKYFLNILNSLTTTDNA
jgi:hypothetical protein